MPTTSLGIQYPASTDDVRLWEHFEDLANTTNTAIAATNTNVTTNTSNIATNTTALAKLTSPARAILRTAVSQAINPGPTVLNLEIEDLDSANGHSTVSNTSRYTVQTGWDGLYQVSGSIQFDATSATGNRGSELRKNGSLINGGAAFYQAGNVANFCPYPTPTILVPLVAGDYVELYAFQGSGSSRNVLNARLDVIRVCD